MNEKLYVLDKGYIRLVDVMGSDLSVVNAARVSFNKESPELTEKDKRLIKYLAEHGHTSPFRHAMATFEVYAPLMVARQWWKYVVGSDHTMDAWNETSRRYVTEDLEFYIPGIHEWRSAPVDKKQGSGEPLPAHIGFELTQALSLHIDRSVMLYELALKRGAAPELARLYLPAYALYVRWRWTASLQSIAHLINQRKAEDAQEEFQRYARALYKLIKPYFTYSLEELVKEG